MNHADAPGSPVLAGRYELGSVLGHGGMGAVHDAIDRRLGRPVAVKILRTELAAQPNARRRFETEAHAAARLAHPNVVTVFDSGEEDGVPFLVMERLPGRTFADELAAGPASVERVREVTLEILAALAAAHAAGIIHRDIKPGNALLTEDGHVKVSDFGIAKTVDDLDQTQTAVLVATPGYLAPERLAGDPASQRSDLYSVGVLLYEALSGRRPFAGDTPLAVMRAIERGKAEPLTSLQPALPADIAAVVARAMSRNPRRRFASAEEMADALESTAPEASAHDPARDLDATVAIEAEPAPETVSILAESSTAGSSDGATQALPAPRRHPVAPQTAGRGGRRRVLAVGAAAVVAGVLVAGVVASQSGDGHPAASVPTTAPAAKKLPAPLDAAISKLEQTVTP